MHSNKSLQYFEIQLQSCKVGCMGATNASVQDCTELSNISQLKDHMNDYDYLKNALSIYNIYTYIYLYFIVYNM